MIEAGKWLMIGGASLLVLGAVFYFAPGSWLSVLRKFGHLPGDISIEKGNFHFYFPITTMLLFSLFLHFLLRIGKYMKLF
jgi:hypothetical protein